MQVDGCRTGVLQDLSISVFHSFNENAEVEANRQYQAIERHA